MYLCLCVHVCYEKETAHLIALAVALLRRCVIVLHGMNEREGRKEDGRRDERRGGRGTEGGKVKMVISRYFFSNL